MTPMSVRPPVREGFAFDEAALAAWMTAHVAGFAGPMSVEQFKGGQSNPTYKLVTPDKSYVLRRKPPGAILKGAHAVEREAKVLIGLGKAGFPVAHVHALCTDDAVIGTLVLCHGHGRGADFLGRGTARTVDERSGAML